MTFRDLSSGGHCDTWQVLYFNMSGTHHDMWQLNQSKLYSTVANIDAPAMDSDYKQRTGIFYLSMLIDIYYKYRSALIYSQCEFKHQHIHHCHHQTHCKLNSPVGTAPQARGREMVEDRQGRGCMPPPAHHAHH
jgi:hypothetical protein